MRQLRAWLVRLKGVLLKGARDRDFADEIESHLQMHIEDNIRTGMSPQEARRVAVMKLGGVDQTKEAYRDRVTIPFLEGVVQDLRFTLRQLRRNFVVTVAAVLTLAAAIGANTAIFSVVNGVLLRSLPYPNADRVVNITTTSSRRGLDDLVLSDAEFNEFKTQTQTLQKMAAYASGAVNLGNVAEPQRIGLTEASVDLFSVLGVQAHLGRTFTPEEDMPGYEPRALISYRLWQSYYGSDPNIVGKTIQLNGRNRLVVGVMPQGFHFPGYDIDVWMQLNLDPASRILTNKYLNTVALLKPGVSREQAAQEINTIYQRVRETYPQYYQNESGVGAAVVGLQEKNVKGIRRALLLLLGAVGFVLLIACANVANLLLARAAVRRKEFAMRSALGCGRWRIVRQLLTESLLLSLIGGALGVMFAFLMLRVLLVNGPLDPTQLQNVKLDLSVLGFTALVTLIVGILFGLAPALHASKVDLNEEIKESGGHGSLGSLRHNRTRSVLVISEVTLSMVLLIGAGLMIQSFVSLLRVNSGIDAAHVLSMKVTVPGAKYPKNPDVTAFYQQLQDRIGAIPGVQSVSVINQLPSDAEKSEASFEIEGHPFVTDIDREDGIADYRMVSPAYFKTMGIPMLRGRTFTEQEGKQSPPAAIINDKVARRFFPGEDPTTKKIRLRPDLPWMQIVGVVPDIKNQGLQSETTQEMYFPYVETSFGLPVMRTMVVVVRTDGDPASLINPVKSELRALDKDLPPYKIQTMDQVLAASVSRTRFTMLLLTVFSVLALVLAAGGVYSVMAYSVAQRTREIGIRNALGAQNSDIFRLIMRQGFVLAIMGVVLGTIAGLALTRVMSNLLFTVSATDPKIFIAVASLLIVVALLACYLPARRATRVNPLTALRTQ